VPQSVREFKSRVNPGIGIVIPRTDINVLKGNTALGSICDEKSIQYCPQFLIVEPFDVFSCDEFDCHDHHRLPFLFSRS
jgi:hypothetical protein